MYLARELTDHSLPEIGRGMGGRSHTTVLHAVNRVSAAMRHRPAVQSAVDNLRAAARPTRRDDRSEWKNQQLPHRDHPAPTSGFARDVNVLDSPNYLKEIGSIS